MKTVMFDGNIFDKLRDDESMRSVVSGACKRGSIRVVISPTVMLELKSSPFRGVPDYFPVEVVAESVAVPGLAIPGLAFPGKGEVFAQHLGESRQGRDAAIADSADAYADVFVSEDWRCRKRLAGASKSCECFDFTGFAKWIAELGQS